MPNTRQFLLASLSMAAIAASQTAIAQETPVADDDTELRQETITVTAQFREQSVIDVPAALTAYEGEFLSDIGVNEFDELSAFVPGLVVQEQSVNNPGFVIRGITSDSGASNIEPRVSVFENGVSIARSRGSIVQLFDIERVEVLKGPQGTLFGRSAQIGAVHVITNKAEQDFNASLQLDAGNFQFFEANGHINVPIIEDKLAGRIAASYSFRDGFLENTESDEELNGTDTVAVRASLRYTPTDKVTFDLIGTYSNDSPPGTSFKSGVIPALGGDTNPNSPASLNTFGNFLGGADLAINAEIWGLTFISDWELGDAWRWVTTASHREFNSLEVFDPDGTAFDLFIFAEDAQGEQTSLDTRFNYDNGGKFRGFFGAGLFVEDGSQEVPLGLGLGEVGAFFGTIPVQTPPDENGVALFFGDPALTQLFLTGDPALLAAAGVPSGLFQLETFTNFSDTSSFDVFAEGEYDITDRLTFTAGVRFT
ncbi:MAG: TonB-dependent receptor, partial [Pseudomonadota bacterium]